MSAHNLHPEANRVCNLVDEVVCALVGLGVEPIQRHGVSEINAAFTRELYVVANDEKVLTLKLPTREDSLVEKLELSLHAIVGYLGDGRSTLASCYFELSCDRAFFNKSATCTTSVWNIHTYPLKDIGAVTLHLVNKEADVLDSRSRDELKRRISLLPAFQWENIDKTENSVQHEGQNG